MALGREAYRWSTPAMLVAIVTTLAWALPAAAAEPVFEKYKVPTVGGAEINVEVMRPAGEPEAPVILTYSPYNTLSETTAPNLANDDLGQRYVERGYARAVADVLGTRNSSGCWDYGGAREQQSGVDLVNALAAQPWSSGKVAMIGGSYDGTTANMVAARGSDAPGLAAIVPELAISRWYGYAYSAGVRYFGNSERPTDEGFDTPLAFDFGITRTPPPGRARACRLERRLGRARHAGRHAHHRAPRRPPRLPARAAGRALTAQERDGRPAPLSGRASSRAGGRRAGRPAAGSTSRSRP